MTAHLRPAAPAAAGPRAVELCRVLPVICSVALAVLVLGALLIAAAVHGWPVAALAAGAAAAGRRVRGGRAGQRVKWLLVGRLRAVDRPLWSSFVWRNELADTFVEMLAVPWLIGPASGTPLLDGLAAHDGRADRPWRLAGVLLAARVGSGAGSATGRLSTGVASCRPTCSTIGS